jgi:PAS domain S-box-containing protein
LKTPKGQPSPPPAAARELAGLRARLAEAEETLRAIRNGEVDAVVVAGKHGPQVFTLQGADHDYRVLIESMNEGALTLTADNVVLYANRCFARMLKCPLEQVMGGSFRRFLSAASWAMLRPLLKAAGKSGSKTQVLLDAGDGSPLPVQISVRPLAKNGSNRAAIGMVVTDMTEARHNEEMLRGLSRRVVQTQEGERRRVALDLHDNITQPLCASLFRSQALADRLSARDGLSKNEAMKLRDLLGKTSAKVEHISRNLRPGVLDNLGLVAVLRDAGTAFANRTGVTIEMACVPLTARLHADAELALYRIFQETLKNVEKHAQASHVTASLGRKGAAVQLVVRDDGIGFDPERRTLGQKGRGGLGLLGMRERAAYVGGSLRITSARRAGTEIDARVPLSPRAEPAK